MGNANSSRGGYVAEASQNDPVFAVDESSRTAVVRESAPPHPAPHTLPGLPARPGAPLGAPPQPLRTGPPAGPPPPPPPPPSSSQPGLPPPPMPPRPMQVPPSVHHLTALVHQLQQQQHHHHHHPYQHHHHHNWAPDFGLRVTCPQCHGVIAPPVVALHPYPRLALQWFRCPCQAILATPDALVLKLIARLRSGQAVYPGLGMEAQLAMAYYMEEERNDVTQRHLIALPTREWVAPTGAYPEEHRTCGVCMESYSEGETLRTLPCLHFFHASCCDPWLIQKRVCPLCRHDITAPVQGGGVAAPTGGGEERPGPANSSGGSGSATQGAATQSGMV